MTSILAQAALKTDLYGMPFLVFGILVGLLWLSLFVRTAWTAMSKSHIGRNGS